METPHDKLALLARAAITAANSNMEKAIELFEGHLKSENSATLERELCREYRLTAIRAILATYFHELRAEGRVAAKIPSVDLPTTNYARFIARERPEGWRGYKTPSEYNDDAQRELQRKWLEEYKINGLPLGKCTVIEADRWAASRERDSKFVRLLIDGLPDDAVIGQHRTHMDAQKCWVRAGIVREGAL